MTIDEVQQAIVSGQTVRHTHGCLLYTSDAAATSRV